MVLAVDTGADAVAYPVRQLAYHHLVADAVGGTPVVATYCTLCHTGLVWQRTLDGRVLTFRLYGINNQNMLMRDEETGSWWQQATGEAIQGPLKGRRLVPFLHSEVDVRRLPPRASRRARAAAGGRVPGSYARAELGAAHEADADRHAARGRRRDRSPHARRWASRSAGARAPTRSRRSAGAAPVNDVVDGVPIAVVVGDDRQSVRVFERTVDGRRLELRGEGGRQTAGDGRPGDGQRVGLRRRRHEAARSSGHRLRRLIGSKQYWFDWKLQRPHTTVYARSSDG